MPSIAMRSSQVNTSNQMASVIKKKNMAQMMADMSNLAPILKLCCINSSAKIGSFVDKEIDLMQPLCIGRQTNTQNPPLPHNGIFESKILSRMHAKIWWENSKVQMMLMAGLD